MIAGGSLQVGLCQQFSLGVGHLAGGGVRILATADGESHRAVDDNCQRHVAVAVTVTALCTAEGGTGGKGRVIELAAHLLVGNLEVLEDYRPDTTLIGDGNGFDIGGLLTVVLKLDRTSRAVSLWSPSQGLIAIRHCYRSRTTDGIFQLGVAG